MARKKAVTKTVDADGVIVVPDSDVTVLPDIVVDKKSILQAMQETKRNAALRMERLIELTIESEEDYKTADLLLAGSRVSKDAAEQIFGPAIKPIRQGLDRLYELQREIVRPWQRCMDIVKDKMAAFKKVEEEKRQEEAQKYIAAQREAQRRLEEERAVQSNNPDLTYSLGPEAVVRVLPSFNPAPVQAEHSSARYKDVAKIVDLETFLLSVVAEIAPLNCLAVDLKALQEWYEENPEAVRNCPGVKVEREVIIASRRW